MCDRFAPLDKGVALPSPTADGFAFQSVDELAVADHDAATSTHSSTTDSVRTVMRD
jgi:hypothetical protein